VKQLRIVSYAINGRGMGHLVRQLAILRQVRRVCALLGVQVECWVLTSSEADTLARRESVPSLKMPSKAMLRDAGIEPQRYLAIARTWVLQTITGLQPDLLLVDTFPGGSFGELALVLELVPHRVLVARAVRPEVANEDAYRLLLPLYPQVVDPDDPATGPILLREPNELLSRTEARRILGVGADARVVWLTVGGGGDPQAHRLLPTLLPLLRSRGWHVVVGAGPLYDGPEQHGPGITWLTRYSPVELFLGLDAAVSAGGYNSFHELMAAGVPTVFLPQPRISDDQRGRAERAVTAGAGRVAGRLTDVPDLLDDLLSKTGAAQAARDLVEGGGALRAALACLQPVLPAADLALAGRLLTPDLVALLDQSTTGMDGAKRALALLRLLSGGTPSEVTARRALTLDLQRRGQTTSTPADRPVAPEARLRRYLDLVAQSGCPTDIALQLAEGLDRKFPAADGDELLEALASLLPAWARFDDWMGALALLRALPTQRGLSLAHFATAATSWLAGQDDLFEAVGAFSRLEANGGRPVAEVLRLLQQPEPQ
jgi:UDP-N-acetylglucosamine--N-acetylmuramyl-(pentapeptide) pyrophosphoryl-undecaprenol N-acetylglucosamine transferase